MGSLEVKHLSKKYKDKLALNNCNFRANSGEIVGIIGHNGAGKTTLFNCIAGNIIPTSGSIYFEDKEIRINSDIRKYFGILIKPAVYNYMNAFEFLSSISAVSTRKIDKDEIKRTIEIVGLSDTKGKKIKSYSFGMKQRLSFAQAMLNGESFMLLDEPFVGLDINARDLVKASLKKISYEKNIPIIFSDHNLDEVKELCTRIIVLNNGEIVFNGNISEIEDYYLLSLDSTKGLKEEKFEIIDEKRIMVCGENLNEVLDRLKMDREIRHIEQCNKLKELINEGEERI